MKRTTMKFAAAFRRIFPFAALAAAALCAQMFFAGQVWAHAAGGLDFDHEQPHDPVAPALISSSGYIGVQFPPVSAGRNGLAFYRVRVFAESNDCTVALLVDAETCYVDANGRIRPSAGAGIEYGTTIVCVNGDTYTAVNAPEECTDLNGQGAQEQYTVTVPVPTFNNYAVQVRAHGLGFESKWGAVARILRDTPPAPTWVDSYYSNGRIHLQWLRTPYPDWFTGKTEGDAVALTGNQVRYLRSGSGVGWLEKAGGNTSIPNDRAYVDRSPTTFSDSFAVQEGEEYQVQVAQTTYGTAAHPMRRRGYWTQPPRRILATTPPLLASGIGDNTARTGAGVSPAFTLVGDLATHNYHIGPIPHDHNRATISLTNTGNSAKFKSLGYTPENAAYTTLDFTNAVTGIQTWTNVHLTGVNPVLDLRVGAGQEASERTHYRLRVHRLTENGVMPAPQGFSLTASEYTDDDGMLTPQMIVKWQPHPLAAGYRVTCQKLAPPADPVQRCTNQVYTSLDPATAEGLTALADGTLSYNLRPSIFWGENVQVKLAAIHDGTAGVFATASQTFRLQSSETKLQNLALDFAQASGVTAADYALEPAFTPERTAYILRVDEPQTLTTGTLSGAIKLAATLQDERASIAVTFPSTTNTDVGETDIDFVVTAENGADTRTYTVTVVRYPNITNFGFFPNGSSNPAPPTPAFQSFAKENVYTYDLVFLADGGTFSFFRDIAAADYFALTNSAGTAYTAATDSEGAGEHRARYGVDIPPGGDTFTLTAAHAEDGYTATYFFRALRPLAPSNDSELKSLRVSGASGDIALTPAFDPDTLVYDLTAPGNLNFVTSAHRHADTHINQEASTGEHVVRIDRGMTPVEIEVTAENGGKTRYLVRVWYPPPQDVTQIPDISALAFSGGTLSPAFSKTTYTYAITGFQRATATTNVTATAATGVTVKVNTTRIPTQTVVGAGHDLPLVFGDNHIIVQTSGANLVTTAYSIFATVQAPVSTDATLHSVNARERQRAVAFTQSGTGATSGAAFASAHLTYAAEVLRTAQSVYINVTAHELATISLNGEAATAGEETQVTLADSGDTTITIVVTAEDGSTVKTYTFTVSRSTANTEPLAPQNLTLTAGDGRLQAVWEAPSSDGGASVGTYFARYREDDPAVAWADTASGEAGLEVAPATPATTFTVTDLPPGVAYEVQVAAANTIGVSAWASARATIGGTVVHPPQVTLLAADAKITATWETPVDSTGAAVTGITEYRIRHAEGAGSTNWASVAGATVSVSGSDNAHSHEITGLQNATVYEVQIAAFKTTRGPWSASESATPSARVLGAPQNLDAAGGNHRISLQWESPSAGTPTGFRVRWAEVMQTMARAWNERDGVTSAPAAGGGGAHVIGDLTPGVMYEVQVAAEDATGRGDWASTLAAPSAFSLDANGDGKTTAADGIIIARYLLGVETEAGGLFAGQIPPNLTAPQKQTLIANLESGKSGGHLNVDASSTTTPDHVDAIFVARYLLGFRGEELGGDATAQSAVHTAIQALMQ